MQIPVHIKKSDVEKIADLARLRLSEEEKETFRGQLEQILVYVDILNELDTDNVRSTHLHENQADVMREDRAEASLTREEALKNAPTQGDGFFRVPKVIVH